MNERMSWSEAEAVVRAFRAERGAGADVDVATLAHALGTDVGEVRRLARGRRRFTDRSGVLSAALAFGVLLAVLLAVGPRLLTRNAAVASLAPTPVRIIHLVPTRPALPEIAEGMDDATAQIDARSLPGPSYRLRILRTM